MRQDNDSFYTALAFWVARIMTGWSRTLAWGRREAQAFLILAPISLIRNAARGWMKLGREIAALSGYYHFKQLL